jgi:hypothetical protein
MPSRLAIVGHTIVSMGDHSDRIEVATSAQRSQHWAASPEVHGRENPRARLPVSLAARVIFGPRLKNAIRPYPYDRQNTRSKYFGTGQYLGPKIACAIVRSFQVEKFRSIAFSKEQATFR